MRVLLARSPPRGLVIDRLSRNVRPGNAEHRDEVASLAVLLLGLAAAHDKYEDAPHGPHTVARARAAAARSGESVHWVRQRAQDERLPP